MRDTDGPPTPGLNSPLRPLAWGFLGLVPLPLLAMLFADNDVALARRVELGFALLLFACGAVLFVVDARARRAGRTR